MGSKLSDTDGVVLKKSKQYEAEKEECLEKLALVEQALEREKKELQKSMEAFKSLDEAHHRLNLKMDQAESKVKNQEDELLRLRKLSAENADDASKHKVCALFIQHSCTRTRVDIAMVLVRRPACQDVEKRQSSKENPICCLAAHSCFHQTLAQ